MCLVLLECKEKLQNEKWDIEKGKEPILEGFLGHIEELEIKSYSDLSVVRETWPDVLLRSVSEEEGNTRGRKTWSKTW